MSVKERLKEFATHLDLTISAFEKEINASNGYINNISKSISLEKISTIKQKYPQLNIEWLLTGEGEMIKNKEPKHEAIPVTAGHVKFIPLVSQYAQAGYLSGFDNPVYMDTLPTIPIIIPQENEAKGEYVCFEVAGDSMISEEDPAESLFEHDLLICRNVNQVYWLSKLHYNKWDFVIVHKTEGVIVKRIINHDVEKGEITIHSLNPLYQDKVLHLKDISQIMNVVMINRNRKR
ncbi:hypothetical protein AV926_04780 [Myroides marinus]|uniref:Peptidase S24/S26A/S26B/S26C domain-containing protein n=1 Tax=Myroides marinus TaxID=703342 RepID=A0A161U9Z1_9FLAO|nr:S24 family peptidase [Myroides marinus]KZE82866.1 hypothetical protein AV926_04780 [Myroides marinus]